MSFLLTFLPTMQNDAFRVPRTIQISCLRQNSIGKQFDFRDKEARVRRTFHDKTSSSHVCCTCPLYQADRLQIPLAQEDAAASML